MDSGTNSGFDTQGAGITVRRALELPGLRSGLPEILAGADRMQRTVRWVHAGEVPNIASLLKGGELLLTTGYGLGTRPAEQRAFVRTLAERGIAALVVELGPRFTRLPAALVDTARAAGLPLVQLHREVPFVAVTEEIHTEIVNGHYALLQRAEEVHRRCTEALLGGGGVPQVLAILADFAGNPVFLETTDGRLLYAAGAGPEGADPLQVWEGLRDPHKDAPPPAGSVLVDVPGGGPGTGSVRARLVLLPVRSSPAPVHRMAAERAAGILAVVLMQARQEEELAARGRGDFLTDLAEGRITAEDAPAQARVLGFKPGAGPLLPVVMRLGDALSPAGGGWAVLARAVAEELASVGVPVLLGVRPVEGRVHAAAGAALGVGAGRGRRPGRGGAAGGRGAGRDSASRGAAPRRGRRGVRRLGGGLGGPQARGGDGDRGAGPDRPALVRRAAPGHRPAAVAAARPSGPRGVRGPGDRPAAGPRRPLQAASAAHPPDVLGPCRPQGGDGPGAPPQPADPLQPARQDRGVAGHGPRRPADRTGVEPGPARPPARAVRGGDGAGA
ncbi:transcriptional regulator [Streptomyces lividans TK24]|nr:transcriptional regulator [Streptomyces lividans TK24]